jgi:hypothetical protein
VAGRRGAQTSGPEWAHGDVQQPRHLGGYDVEGLEHLGRFLGDEAFAAEPMPNLVRDDYMIGRGPAKFGEPPGDCSRSDMPHRAELAIVVPGLKPHEPRVGHLKGRVLRRARRRQAKGATPPPDRSGTALADPLHRAIGDASRDGGRRISLEFLLAVGIRRGACRRCKEPRISRLRTHPTRVDADRDPRAALPTRRPMRAALAARFRRSKPGARFTSSGLVRERGAASVRARSRRGAP